jgi:mono/diheme cytochrome c family protein
MMHAQAHAGGARSRFTAVLAAALLLVACNRGTPLERGARIFQRTCSPCHGADGRKGSAAVQGFNPPPRDLTDHDFQSQRSDDQLRRSIRLGKGQMPAFGGILDDDDVSSVLVFIRTLDPSAPGGGAGGSPPLAPTSGPALGLTGDLQTPPGTPGAAAH